MECKKTRYLPCVHFSDLGVEVMIFFLSVLCHINTIIGSKGVIYKKLTINANKIRIDRQPY